MESILNFWHDWEKKQAQMLHFVHFLQSLPFKHSCTFKNKEFQTVLNIHSIVFTSNMSYTDLFEKIYNR